ncbi:MAG: phosphate signaling complex protein PhoU [Intestinibacter sp.]|uniref:phosphate signaling complex protein PhoU n=1 Tax=Intestinibacter sp. TaxID=1965304 RepID=UPI003F177586
MASTNLEMSIKTLKEYINRMMDKCEEAIELSVKSMINKDVDLAKKVINNDDDVDILREYIRDRSIELMALKQPMAKDLREIYALSDISTELERIGDYAANIASEVVAIAGEDYIKELVDIPKMTEHCLDMFRNLKTAFINQDADLAYKVALIDNEIDVLYYKVREDCLRVMHENPEQNINQGVKLLFVGRYLERIGDHITNVCEKIIYARNGKMIEIG